MEILKHLSIFFFIYSLTFAQAQLLDDFTDNNLTEDPQWSSIVSDHFEVTGNRLHLKAPSQTATSYLSTPSKAIINGSWEFDFIFLAGTSSSNKGYVYLASDTENLNDTKNGYYVLIGNTADQVSLYKTINGISSKIIDGTDKLIDGASVDIRVKITRDINNKWELWVDTSTAKNQFTLHGRAIDNSFISSSYFGVLCDYTATRSELFYFDNFKIKGEPFKEIPSPFSKYDVIISEFLVDPSPKIFLPEGEFIELYNRTDSVIEIKGWTLSDPSSSIELNFNLQPKEYITLCHDDNLEAYAKLGRTYSFPSFPSLNNSADTITLKDHKNNLIHSIAYTDDWYKNTDKQKGGWSLEMIDFNQLCMGKENWSASRSQLGGTPSFQNSTLKTLEAFSLSISNQFPIDSKSIQITFNQNINSTDVVLPPHYSLDTVIVSKSNQLTLSLNEPLIKNRLITIQLNNLKNCQDFLYHTSFEIGLPDSLIESDLVFNEILFNPASGGVDFIEIKNVSNKLININTLHISNDFQRTYPITQNRIMKPNEIIVLTENKSTLIQYHHPKYPDNIIEIDLPSLPDDEGSIILLDDSGYKIDLLEYNSDWHFTFLREKDGVSLEKIKATNFTNDSHNWFSASSQVNYATPTEENSQAFSPNSTGSLSLVSNAISPDGDGENDLLIVQYQYKKLGLLLNAKIFSRNGILVKQLINNESLNTKGQITWEGQTNQGTKAPLGIYILVWQITDAQGQTTTTKKTFSIGSKL